MWNWDKNFYLMICDKMFHSLFKFSAIKCIFLFNYGRNSFVFNFLSFEILFNLHFIFLVNNYNVQSREISCEIQTEMAILDEILNVHRSLIRIYSNWLGNYECGLWWNIFIIILIEIGALNSLNGVGRLLYIYRYRNLYIYNDIDNINICYAYIYKSSIKAKTSTRYKFLKKHQSIYSRKTHTISDTIYWRSKWIYASRCLCFSATGCLFDESQKSEHRNYAKMSTNRVVLRKKSWKLPIQITVLLDILWKKFQESFEIKTKIPRCWQSRMILIIAQRRQPTYQLYQYGAAISISTISYKY